MLHLFSAVLLVLFIFSWLVTRKNLREVNCSIQSVEEEFTHTPVKFSYIISNFDSDKKVALDFEDTTLDYRFSILELLAKNSVRLFYDKEFTKRGVYDWQSVTLECRYPFGFIESIQKLDLKHTITVLPKPKPVENFSIQSHEKFYQEGNIATQTRSARETFANLREYQPGDSWHNIHWKASAKNNQLITKEFEENHPPLVSIILEGSKKTALSAEDYQEKFEDLLEVASSLICSAHQQGKIFLIACGKESLVCEDSVYQTPKKMLHMLARADWKQLLKTPEKTIASIPGGSVVIVVALENSPEILEKYSKYPDLDVMFVFLEGSFTPKTQLACYQAKNDKDKVYLEMAL
jgi:uncharacterized protein (DUF58 family)